MATIAVGISTADVPAGITQPPVCRVPRKRYVAQRGAATRTRPPITGTLARATRGVVCSDAPTHNIPAARKRASLGAALYMRRVTQRGRDLLLPPDQQSGVEGKDHQRPSEIPRVSAGGRRGGEPNPCGRRRPGRALPYLPRTAGSAPWRSVAWNHQRGGRHSGTRTGLAWTADIAGSKLGKTRRQAAARRELGTIGALADGARITGNSACPSPGAGWQTSTPPLPMPHLLHCCGDRTQALAGVHFVESRADNSSCMATAHTLNHCWHRRGRGTAATAGGAGKGRSRRSSLSSALRAAPRAAVCCA